MHSGCKVEIALRLLLAATADSIRNRIKTILQMAAVLQYYSSLPVVKVGRMAGQFAKPRSNDLETRGDVTLPAYRGDAVNDLEFTLEARTPNPQRLVDVYNTSAATLNLGSCIYSRWFCRYSPRPRMEQGFYP